MSSKIPLKGWFYLGIEWFFSWFTVKSEKTTEEGPEYPLDGSIFEDIVREAWEEQSKDNQSGEYRESAEAMTGCLSINADNKEKEGANIDGENENANDATFDIKFYEIIVRIIGTEA